MIIFNQMKVKFLIILAIFLCLGEPLTAAVVMSKGSMHGGKKYHETWYLGSNEEVFQYHKYGGGTVDDGLFVAIYDGGAYGGYSYYEIKLPVTGQIDGGPAYLPNNPGNYAVSGFNIIANGKKHGERDGFRKTWRDWVPELPDGSIIPIGSKFFFWISRGGSFSLTDAVFEKKIEIVQEVQEEEESATIPEESANTQETLEQAVIDMDAEIEDFLRGMDDNDDIDVSMLYGQNSERQNAL